MRLYRSDYHTNRRLILIVYRGSSALHSTCVKNAPNTRRPGDEHSIMPLAPPGHNKLRRSTQYTSHQTIGSMHWLFRTNIPRKRSSYYPADVRKRNFFGIGEIMGVLTNPAETVRSLTESKRLLDEARQEIVENRERSQIRPKHTFSRLPGFFPREAEVKAIERALEGEPAFTVLFGASSVGKTALLREVLCRDTYHVLHFDLRIAGFADLASLYMSLSRQMEQYFEALATQMEGYEDFEKEAWSFKHDRLHVERRMTEGPPDSGINRVRTSDIARLMELFQSSLLKYWEFDPYKEEDDKEKKHKREEASGSSSTTRVNSDGRNDAASSKQEHNGRFRNLLHFKSKKADHRSQQYLDEEKVKEAERQKRPAKKMPVIFFDEAHKLPALIQSTEAMNCLLSAFLVLTKQDRLCHVIHATSDPFYHTWLRQLNVMQHCKIITIGDCSKAETRIFFRERMLPRVPEHLQHALDFEVLYDALGGKLVHLQDFVTDYVNSNGRLDIKQSSHFLQAHALLNLHAIHSSENPSPDNDGQEDTVINHNPNLSRQSDPTRPSGFKIYSPISNPRGPSGQDFDGGGNDLTSAYESDFTAMQLLRVMSRITEPGATYLPYFMLCREFGVQVIDGMVKGRILDLRWTELVTKETEPEDASYLNRQSRLVRIEGGGEDTAAESSGRTVVDNTNHARIDAVAGSEEDIIAISEREIFLHEPRRSSRRRDSRRRDTYYDAMMDAVVGPKLVPATPIMKYAMREVLREYEEMEEEGDGGSVSEYASAASISEVEEY